MDQNRWKTINEIFHAALEVSSSERYAFVATATKGDSDLQAEVELLLRADERAGSYIESPLFQVGLVGSALPALQTGDVLCNRFRIDRAIAEGGMGQVFEAFDNELSVRVALKVIRPEIASDVEALERFRQEARLARRITHPNVCRTFDIERETRAIDASRGTKQTLIFLTMEFLEGETLSSLIKRAGRLPLNQCLSIARQIAEGLAAAHSLGVIHRDIKPANIMLVPNEDAFEAATRAVITDFGLARLDPLVSTDNVLSLSHTARPIGTLAYMAPEQLQGAPISSATDVYAFGLMLFEMVTGKRTFPSENLLSGVAQRLTGPAPDPRSIVPNLPTSWCRAIEICLRLNPADRFQSATDVIAVLEGEAVKSPSPRRRPNRTRWSPIRLAAEVTAVLIALSLLIAEFRLHQARGASGVSPGALVYLAQVNNQTGEKSLDNLTELLKAGLAQSTQINLLAPDQVGEILQQMTRAPNAAIDQPTGREIAMRAGAVRCVFASISKSSGSYALNVDIQQLDNTPARYRDHWTRTFQWRFPGPGASSDAIPPELSNAMRGASDWIRHEVGESANDIARLSIPPEDVTTSSWQALSDFEEAENYARSGKRDEAVIALQSAIQQDRGFALAYARLGDIEVNLSHEDYGFRSYIKALDESSNRRLSLRERDRIKGIYALDTHDFRTSEEAFREYSALYEHDYLGWFYLAYPLSMLGQSQEAKKDLERAHAVAPDRVGAVGMLVLENLIIGDIQEANRWESVMKTMHYDDESNFGEGVIAFVAGDFGAATKAFRKMRQSSSPTIRSESSRYLADLAGEEGDYREAGRLLTEGLADEGEDPQMLLDRAFASGMMKNIPGCVDDLQKAVEKDRSSYTYLRAGQILGELISRLGSSSTRQLKELLASLDRSIPSRDVGLISDEARIRVRGELLLANGQTERALSEFRKADKLEAPNLSREYLGRALEVAAARASNYSKSTELRKQAVDAYAVLALHPGIVWRSPTEYPPGFYAENLEAWIRVVKELGMRAPSYQTSLARLEKMRPGASVNLFPDRSTGNISQRAKIGATQN